MKKLTNTQQIWLTRINALFQGGGITGNEAQILKHYKKEFVRGQGTFESQLVELQIELYPLIAGQKMSKKIHKFYNELYFDSKLNKSEF